MGEFSAADKSFRDAIEATHPALVSAFAAATEVEILDLNVNPHIDGEWWEV